MKSTNTCKMENKDTLITSLQEEVKRLRSENETLLAARDYITEQYSQAIKEKFHLQEDKISLTQQLKEAQEKQKERVVIEPTECPYCGSRRIVISNDGNNGFCNQCKSVF